MIAPDGDLDLYGLEPFRACLESAVECGAPIVVVDFARVALLSAGGVNVLLQAARELAAADRVLRVSNATGIVDRVLDVLGVYSVLDGSLLPDRTSPD